MQHDKALKRALGNHQSLETNLYTAESVLHPVDFAALVTLLVMWRYNRLYWGLSLVSLEQRFRKDDNVPGLPWLRDRKRRALELSKDLTRSDACRIQKASEYVNLKEEEKELKACLRILCAFHHRAQALLYGTQDRRTAKGLEWLEAIGMSQGLGQGVLKGPESDRHPVYGDILPEGHPFWELNSVIFAWRDVGHFTKKYRSDKQIGIRSESRFKYPY